MNELPIATKLLISFENILKEVKTENEYYKDLEKIIDGGKKLTLSKKNIILLRNKCIDLINDRITEIENFDECEIFKNPEWYENDNYTFEKIGE